MFGDKVVGAEQDAGSRDVAYESKPEQLSRLHARSPSLYSQSTAHTIHCLIDLPFICQVAPKLNPSTPPPQRSP